MRQLPNFISIFRTVLAVALAFIVVNNPKDFLLLNYAFWITWIVIILDGIDGIVARIFKTSSDFGSFFDIACDRITELVYIYLFSVLRWIPFGILIVFITRGILVDGIRGLAMKEGKTAFGEKSMMESSIGYFLTSSRFMRFSYGGIKAVALSLMFLVHSSLPQFLAFEMFLIYLMTFYCVIRGVPVLIEGRRYFK